MKKTIFLIILSLVFTNVFSQAKTRKLPTTINHPSVNVSAPCVSFDGNALLFFSDNAEDFALTPFYTLRESDWKEPAPLPKNVNNKLILLRSHSLSADGKRLFCATIKAPGVGGYDLVYSDYKGTAWTEPMNMSAPINSKAHETGASLTVEGNGIYFTRCDKVDQGTLKADACKIFYSKKKSNGQWEEPVELPAMINTGNSQTPRIMADNETLIFSSNRMPAGKGGMDLYVTKLKDGTWSMPKPLDFVNTVKDDQYISVTALGRYLMKDAPGVRKSEIVEYLIPNELRPRGMMKVDGNVTGPTGAPTPAYISVVDLSTKKRIYNGRPNADGSFLSYLMEGTKYELSIDPEQGNVSFFTKQFDLTSDKIPQVEKVNAVLKPVTKGDEIELSSVSFQTNSSQLDPGSSSELTRFSRMVKASPQFKFEIQVLLSGYTEDSVRSSEDLTEVTYDSILAKYDDIDTLGQLYQRDTILTKITYHNNRTQKQADAVVRFLAGQGVPPANLGTFGNAIPALTPDSRKITVRAAVRSK